MSEEVAVVLDGREFTEDEFVSWLKASGAPEWDVSAFVQMIGMHRMVGLLPLHADDLPFAGGDSL